MLGKDLQIYSTKSDQCEGGGRMKKFLTLFIKWVHSIFLKIKAAIALWIARRKFYSSVLQMATKGYLSKEEMDDIEESCKQLSLSLNNLKGVSTEAYRRALSAVSLTGNVTMRKEEELNQIQDFFNIPNVNLIHEKEELAHLRILAEIRDGNLPVLNSVEIVLQKEEQAYWSEPSSLIEQQVVGRHYEGGSQGFSFRIAKGVTYRVGSQRGQLITDKRLVKVSSGSLIFTNKRLIFTGQLKSFDIKLNKVLSVSFAHDGMIFTTGNRENPYLVQFKSQKNVEIIQAILSQSMKLGQD